jgi:anti-anti-sigma factor
MTDVQITIQDAQSKATDVANKVVVIVGQLDESNVDQKSTEIYKMIESVKPGQKLNVIFDFAGLDYMNSKSIGYLTDWYSKISTDGGKLAISSAKDNILDILQVVGLTQLITCYKSLDEAKGAIFG